MAIESVFAQKKARVLVVDPSGASRMTLTETIRSFGFADVQGVATISDCIGLLEVEKFDWICTSLLSDKDVNGMQLLFLITKQPQLKFTYVSLLLEEAEESVLPQAYGLGLLSHFVKPYNKDSFTKEIEEFYKKMESYEWNLVKMASDGLRNYLKKNRLFSLQLELEKSMIEIYPGDTQLILEAAMCQFEMGQKKEAKASLKQAALIDKNSKQRILELAEKMFSENEKDLLTIKNDDEILNILGLKTCVVVDSDSASSKFLQDLLQKLGVEEVKVFDDGETAVTWIQHSNTPIDLIVQEWKIPKLTGPIFIQRIHNTHPNVPIVVVSSLLKPEDGPLLKEMGVSSLLPKPVESNNFIQLVIQAIQKDRLPNDAESLETKIRKLLESNQYEEALKLNERYKLIPTISPQRKKKIYAEIAYAEKKYGLARDLAVEAIKVQSDSIFLLNLLGKCLMQLDQHSMALKCFEKAQTMSPMNIKRLCMIAEIKEELGDSKGAEEAIAKAKGLDKESPVTVETEAVIKVSAGESEEAKNIMKGIQDLAQIVSFLNNKAISYARSGMIKESLELYEKTIESIPEDKIEIKGIVYYNMGLAFVRDSQLDEAASCLNKSMELANKGTIFAKSTSLQKRVDDALKKGKTLILKEIPKKDQSAQSSGDDVVTDEVVEDQKAIIAAIETYPGDLCLYLVYEAPEESKGLAAKLLSSTPRFKSRSVIKRAEAGGLEKEMKHS